VPKAGKGTESFGPLQITLQNAHVKGTLHPGRLCDIYIKAATPHNFSAQNMHYLGKLENRVLFRAPSPKA